MVAAPALKRIGAFCSHNTSNTPSRKQYEKDSANKPVHDEGDDYIASNYKYMFLVQSHLGQEEGRTTMLDNVLIAAPAQVSQNNMELTANPTQ